MIADSQLHIMSWKSADKPLHNGTVHLLPVVKNRFAKKLANEQRTSKVNAHVFFPKRHKNTDNLRIDWY